MVNSYWTKLSPDHYLNSEYLEKILKRWENHVMKILANLSFFSVLILVITGLILFTSNKTLPTTDIHKPFAFQM